MTTGERLRRAIERRYGEKTSQAEAARKLDVPAANLSEWLNDKYEPTVGTLRHLADKLKCSVASLIGDEAA